MNLQRDVGLFDDDILQKYVAAGTCGASTDSELQPHLWGVGATCYQVPASLQSFEPEKHYDAAFVLGPLEAEASQPGYDHHVSISWINEMRY